MEDLRVLFFFYMMEGILVGFTGMALIGIRLSLKKVIVIGILQGVVVYSVRGFYAINGIPFGSHTLINLLGLILILQLVARKGLGISAVGGILSFIFVLLSESVTYPILFNIFSTTFEQMIANPWQHIFLAYAGDTLLIVVALLVLLTKRTLIDMGGQTGLGN